MSASSPGSIPPPDPFRVFLDSSVLLGAALSSRGSARDLIREAFHDRLRLLASTLVLIETERNLAGKTARALPSFLEIQASGVVHLVEPTPELVHRVARMVVAKDAPIVAGAITGRGTFLASDDRKHLLQQGPVIFTEFGLVVAPPEQILSTI